MPTDKKVNIFFFISVLDQSNLVLLYQLMKKKLDILKPAVIVMLQSLPIDNSIFDMVETPFVNESHIISKNCHSGENALSFMQKYYILNLTIKSAWAYK